MTAPEALPLYRVRVHVQDVHDRRLHAVEYVHAYHEVEAEERALSRLAARSLSIVGVIGVERGRFVADSGWTMTKDGADQAFGKPR